MAAPSGPETTFTNELHSAPRKDAAGADSRGNKARGGGGESGRRLLGPAAATATTTTSAAAANNKMIMPDSQFHLTWIQVRVVVALYIIWITPVRVVSVSS